jgi:glycosyltransferase involved in cell wall biosynthesis
LADRLGVSENVTFHGRVDDEELADMYACGDVFVLPAIVDSHGDTEGLGVVLLEAMSYRKPVIGTNVGGIPDIIHHEVTGLLVEQKDPGALAEAIERLFEDREFARRLGQQGAAYVQQRFDWSHIVDQVEALYHGQDTRAQ